MSNSTNSATFDGAGEETESGPRTDGLLSTSVVDAFSDAEGVDPADLDIQLYQYIDLEALNRLRRHFEDMNGSFWSIEFSIEEYDVVVRADGTVSVQ